MASTRILTSNPPPLLRKPPSLAVSIAQILQNLNPQEPVSQAPLNDPYSSPLVQFAPHLNPDLVIQVINTVREPNHALFFFNWASNPSPNPTNYSHSFPCYLAVLDHLLSHQLLSKATIFLESHGKLCDFTAGKIIKAFGNQRDIRSAVDLFHRIKSLEGGRCLSSCNSLLSVLVKSNKVAMARAIFDQMVSEDVVTPNVWSYSIMIKGYCQSGMVEYARKLFDEMSCKANSVTYNTLIRGLCRKGLMDDARELVDQMIQTRDHCQPDVVTYTTLIDGYCKKHEIEEAMDCMNEMRIRNLEINVRTYNALIHGLCLAGKVDEAKRMMTKMRLNGVKGDVVTHTSLLLGLCRTGRLDEGIRYLRDMTSSIGIEPDAKAYGLVLNECCRMGRSNEAISLLKEMKWRDMTHSTSSINAVLRVITYDVDNAIHLLHEMPEMGCSPNFLSYSLVISSLCEVDGRTDELNHMLSDMIQSGYELDAHLYSGLVKKFCKEGNVGMGVKYFTDSINSRNIITPASFSVMVEELCRKGRVSEAEKYSYELYRSCPVSRLESYRQVLYEKIKDKQSITINT